MVSDVMAEAGTNMSIGCPGITRNTFVVHLEWRCRGQCGGGSSSVVGYYSGVSNDIDIDNKNCYIFAFFFVLLYSKGPGPQKLMKDVS